MIDNARIPVRTTVDLDTLDADEVVEGYRDGYEDWPCGDNRSRSFWHGWKNGRVDAGLAEKDVDQAALAEDYMQRQKTLTLH